LATAGAATAPGGRSMRAAFDECRRPSVSGSGRDTLDSRGGMSSCQGFDLTILFQEYQEYQLPLPRQLWLLSDIGAAMPRNAALEAVRVQPTISRQWHRPRHRAAAASAFRATKISGARELGTDIGIPSAWHRSKCLAAAIAQYNGRFGERDSPIVKANRQGRLAVFTVLPAEDFAKRAV
jgi:hypothetical protein